MSATNAIPTGDARPTDDRGGPPIVPTRVTCPYCGREGVTERAVNLCRCGRWFEVVDPEEGSP